MCNPEKTGTRHEHCVHFFPHHSRPIFRVVVFSPVDAISPGPSTGQYHRSIGGVFSTPMTLGQRSFTVKVEAYERFSAGSANAAIQPDLEADPRMSAATLRLRKDLPLRTPKQHSDRFISAVFSYEYIDDDVIEQIHRGEVDKWITDIAGLGMFAKAEVCAIARGWRSDPKTLLDALLVDVDEITVKRCEVAWTNLDQAASLRARYSAELDRTLTGTVLDAVKIPET